MKSLSQRALFVAVGIGAALSITSATARAGNIIPLNPPSTNGGTAAVGGNFGVVEFDNSGSGSGTFTPFVRVSQSASTSYEEGYNTGDGSKPLNDQSGPNFITGIQLSSIPTVTFNGVSYYVFTLDAAQSGGGPLSLNQVQIFTSNAALGGSDYIASGGTLALDANQSPPPLTNSLMQIQSSVVTAKDVSEVFRLNQNDATLAANNEIQILNVNNGNGHTDMLLYVAASDFAGDSPSTYVTLFSQFGHEPGAYGADGSFEEWGVQQDVTILPPPPPFLTGVPEPASMAVWGVLGLAFVCRHRRRAE
jgi:hypothetical protein